jgi:hypothetical protein
MDVLLDLLDELLGQDFFIFWRVMLTLSIIIFEFELATLRHGSTNFLEI